MVPDKDIRFTTLRLMKTMISVTHKFALAKLSTILGDYDSVLKGHEVITYTWDDIPGHMLEELIKEIPNNVYITRCLLEK